MQGWHVIQDLIITLAAAVLLGGIFDKLRLGTTVGFILAGVAIGPSAFGLVTSQDTVNGLAEFGIALVLFSIGLEFSALRLKKLGRGVIYAGIAQILLTLLVAMGITILFGIDLRQAAAFGAVIAMSSTVIALKVLRENGELDAGHGKSSFGVLVIQDIALIPLVLLIVALSPGRHRGIDWSDFTSKAGIFVIVAVIFVLLVTRLIPRALSSSVMAGNREFPVLTALVTCIGAAWAAHEVGLSASLGAFIAGILLAESPFAHQIRSDVAPFKVVFSTIFFVSVGMLADVRWLGANLGVVVGVTLMVMLGKVATNFVAIRVFKRVTKSSLGAAFVLANVGELGLILVQVAAANRVFDAEMQRLATGVVIVSMLFATFVVRGGPRWSERFCHRFMSAPKLDRELREEEKLALHNHIVVLGYGTAGRTAAQLLATAQYSVVVVDQDPKFVNSAREIGAIPILGDATRIDLLQELHLNDAIGMIVALPDHRQAGLATQVARQICPDLPIVVRSRNHAFRQELEHAGATVVLGEEGLVGRRMGEELLQVRFGKEDQDLELSETG